MSKRRYSIIIVMIGILFSRMLGFIRMALISTFFGASSNADVLNLMLSLPNTLRNLLAEGSLNTAVVPELSRSIKRNSDIREAKKIVSSVLSIQFIILSLIVAIFSIDTERTIYIFLQFEDTEQVSLALQMLKYIWIYLFFLSINALCSAIYDCHNRFLLSSVAPLLSSAILIIFIAFTSSSLGVFSVLWGLLVGSFVQIIIMLPQLIKIGYSFIPHLYLKFPPLSNIFKTWLPVWSSVSMFALMQQIAHLLASGLEVGSNSSLAYALVFFQLPYGLFYASISKVTLPQMSRQLMLEDRAKIKGTMRFGIQNLIVLIVPAIIFIIIFRHELIAIAFQRGKFGLLETQRTAEVLYYYIMGVLSVAVFNFVLKLFFSNKNIVFSISLAGAAAIVDIGLSLILIRVMGVPGLALANTIALTLVCIAGMILATKVIGQFINREIIKSTAKVILSGLIVWAIFTYLPVLVNVDIRQGSTLENGFKLLLNFFIFVSLILIAYISLNVKILDIDLKYKLKVFFKK